VLFKGVYTYSNGDPAPISLSSSKTLRSLWFDATYRHQLSAFNTTGTTLTLTGDQGTPNRLITVSSDGNTGEETLISMAIKLGSFGTGVIENQSEGGLGFNSGGFDLGSQHLRIQGSKATHFEPALTGTGSITVATGLPASPTHLVLFGPNNNSWSGAFTIQSQAFGVVADDRVLGTGANTVLNRGTLGFRRSSNNTSLPILTTIAAAQPIVATGQGIVRQTGVQRVGAIYGDGGKIISNDKINFTNHTWFGARGDINGYLELRGQVTTGGAFDFRKVSPGLITLSNPNTGTNANNWRQTIIEGGVLRQGHVNALPAKNIRFDGGILELGASNLSRKLGTGATDQIRWFQNLDGGFSNFTGGTGLTRSVTLNSGAALTWGQQHFVQDGAALLLSSRYADAPIEFTNALSLGTSATGSHREVRVEAALSPNAYGILSGNITSPGGSIQYDGDGNAIGFTTPPTGLLKTGDGLLKLTHTVPTSPIEDWLSYLYPFIIRGGALLKPDNQASPVRLDAGSSGTGGVLGVTQVYQGELGTGLNQIQWTGSGGFAGYGTYVWAGIGPIVSIEGGAELEWGVTPHFVAADQELRFGHYTATDTVWFNNPIELGPGTKTIRVARGQHDGPDVEFWQPLSSPNGAILEVVGDGRLDVRAYIDKLRISHLRIKGAEFRLGWSAYLAASDIIVEATHGGTITLDGRWSELDNLIHIMTRYSLNAGNLRFISKVTPQSYESANTIDLLGGHNSIELHKDLSYPEALQSTDMHYTIDKLSHSHVSATFNAISSRTFATTTGLDKVRLQVDNAATYEFGTGNNKVIPWFTVNDASSSLTSFATTTTNNAGETYVHGYTNYSSGASLNNWLPNNNIHHTGGFINVFGNRTINSLRMTGSVLNLNSSTLTIGSGGLLSTGTGNTTIRGNSFASRITTANNRPLYIHVYNNRLIFDGASIFGGMDLVKTGPGELFFSIENPRTHILGNLYVNEGAFIVSGVSTRISISGEIFVGDGAGTDVLQLGVGTNGFTATYGFPKITLRGTPYDSRGPEYGGPQAILRMGGRTNQHLSELHIENRGTIDWFRGSVGRANILYLDNLTFSGPDAILFMRNWYEYEDRLLVKQYGGFNPAYLQNIIFEGYENFPVIMRKYDWQYWEITPFGTDNTMGFMPEPSTYGAILGAVGLGLWTWRRKTLGAVKRL